MVSPQQPVDPASTAQQDSSCANHASKPAAATCDRCGDYVCRECLGSSRTCVACQEKLSSSKPGLGRGSTVLWLSLLGAFAALLIANNWLRFSTDANGALLIQLLTGLLGGLSLALAEPAADRRTRIAGCALFLGTFIVLFGIPSRPTFNWVALWAGPPIVMVPLVAGLLYGGIELSGLLARRSLGGRRTQLPVLLLAPLGVLWLIGHVARLLGLIDLGG